MDQLRKLWLRLFPPKWCINCKWFDMSAGGVSFGGFCGRCGFISFRTGAWSKCRLWEPARAGRCYHCGVTIDGPHALHEICKACEELEMECAENGTPYPHPR